MTTADQTLTGIGGTSGILDREHIIAKAGFNRWLVPPAALCIHLCIGMAYGFSVFWLPLSRAIGLTASKSCPDMSIFSELVTTTCDWRVASLGWMYTLFFVFLGISAAMFGGWVERAGPRKAGVAAACAGCGGLVLGAIGVITHQLWLIWLGSGVIGGIGPRPRLHLAGVDAGEMVSRPARHGNRHGHHGLRRRRHDRRAAGEHADELLQDADRRRRLADFLAMGAIYFVFMMIGAFRYRIPPAGWRPDGWTPPSKANAMISQHNVHLKDAHKTPQFWLIWWVLT